MSDGIIVSPKENSRTTTNARATGTRIHPRERSLTHPKELLVSTAVEKPQPRQETRPSPVPRNGRWAGFRHLLQARMLELVREREVIFWVFVFPLLLALGLGFAFRDKPVAVSNVAIISGPRASDTVQMLGHSPSADSVHANIADEQAAMRGFRLGKYDLVVRPSAEG